MLGMPELLHDPRFTDPVRRPLHHDDFEAIFWGWCADRTMLEVVQTAQAAHIPAAPVYAPHRVPGDPHFRARGALVDLPTPYGDFPNAGPPFRSAGMGWRPGPAPRLGAGNRALLGGPEERGHEGLVVDALVRDVHRTGGADLRWRRVLHGEGGCPLERPTRHRGATVTSWATYCSPRCASPPVTLSRGCVTPRRRSG